MLNVENKKRMSVLDVVLATGFLGLFICLWALASALAYGVVYWAASSR